MKSIVDYVDLQIIDLYEKLKAVLDKYCLDYSLWSDGLLAVKNPEYFQVFLRRLNIIVSVADRNLIINALQEEADGCLYYVHISDDLEDYSIYFCKRSRVDLPGSRTSDRFYYDYKVKLVFYVPISTNQYGYVIRQYLYTCALANLCKRKRLHESRLKKYLGGFLNAFINIKIVSFLYIKKINAVKGFGWGVFPSSRVVNVINYFGVNVYKDIKCVSKYSVNGLTFNVLDNYAKYLNLLCDNNIKDELKLLSKNMAFLSGPEELRRVQKIQLDILKEIKRICDLNNIEYFICSGTLLGAVRHRGFIPWDYDADVGMLKEYYDKFISAANKQLDKDKYFLRTIGTENDAHITYAQIRKNNTLMTRVGREHIKNTHHGVLVDIFPVYNGPNNFIIFYFITKLCMFFKTALWTKSGFKAEKSKVRVVYYGLVKKYISSSAWELYIALATRYSARVTKKVMWLVANKNPYFSDYTDANLYRGYKEIEFENDVFKTVKNPIKYLKSVYTNEYVLYPPGDRKLWGFSASMFSAGNEYMYDFESIERKISYEKHRRLVDKKISSLEIERLKNELKNIVFKRKIGIYGAGMITGPAIYELLMSEGYEIDLVIDGDTNKWGRLFFDKTIESGLEHNNKSEYVIFIAVRGSKITEVTIKNKLIDMGYENIIICGDWLGLRAILNKMDYNIMSNGLRDGYLEDKSDIKKLYNIVYDEESLAALNRICQYRKSPQTVNYIYYSVSYFPVELIAPEYTLSNIVDCGACKGDVFEYFVKNINEKFSSYYMIEMDPINVADIKEKYNDFSGYNGKVSVFDVALSDSKGLTNVYLDGSVGSRLDVDGKYNSKIMSDKLNHLLVGREVDLIKMDIEGAELLALKGGEAIIRKNRPVLSISLYHCDNDLWEIPLYIHDAFDNYCLFIRCEDLCDYILYAIPVEKLNKDVKRV